MKIAFFLGAGASVPFGKPTTLQLRQNLRDKYPASSNEPMLWSLLEHHRRGDIEDVLQTIKELKSFDNNKGGNFFNSEFNIILSNKKNYDVNFSTKKKLQTENEKINYVDFISSITRIEKLLENEIFFYYQWRHEHDNKVVQIYDRIFQKLGNHEIRFGTTNYDRVIEEYCIKSKKLCIDGFRFDPIIGRSIWQNGNYPLPYSNDNESLKTWLYKLHGSLNWKQHTNYGIVKTDDESKLSLDEKHVKNLLIYPTISPKDGHVEEPFKTIRSRFAEFLKESDVCVVIGFSFRDEHVNDILKEFIQTKKRFIVISPSMPDALYENLVGKNEYNFGQMSNGDIIDIRNITIFKEEFELATLDKILSLIITRSKMN